VKTIATGSSSFLLRSLKQDTLLSEDRLDVMQLEHAPKDAVIKALVDGMHYSAADAEAIWKVAGGKLRDLRLFLDGRIPDSEVPVKLCKIRTTSIRAIEDAFSKCSPADPDLSPEQKRQRAEEQRMLVAVLDGVCKGKQLSLHALPKQLQNEAGIGKVLYLQAYPNALALQSASVACVWPELRSNYTH
jgi:hypothetical protein